MFIIIIIMAQNLVKRTYILSFLLFNHTLVNTVLHVASVNASECLQDFQSTLK